MKTLKWLLLTVLFLTGLNYAEAKKNSDAQLDYQIEGAGTGVQGSYLVKVTVFSKDKKLEDSHIQKCAVHGVLFKGFSSTENRQSQKPLAGSAAAEAQHIDFYKEFFSESGTAHNYASLVPGSRSITKVEKGYRISEVVTVNKATLQKYLEDVGILRGLNSAF